MGFIFFIIITVSAGVTTAVFNNITQEQLHRYFSRLELRKLEYLKDFVCGYEVSQADNAKHDPYFCVLPEDCQSIHSTANFVQQSFCDEREFHYGKTTCCYIGDVMDSGKLIFTSDPKFWGLNYVTNTSITDYAEKLYREHVHPKYQELLDANLLCGLQPYLQVNRWLEEDTYYLPFYCRNKKCDEDLAWRVETYYSLNQFQPRGIQSADGFCNTKSGPGYCCHAITLMTDDFANNYIDEISQYRLKTMSKFPNAAVGFKSSFQCEQFSRLHCEGDFDRCSLRILNRDTAVPGEFPHQALLGIQGRSFRHFHCSGTLVSRYFILSAYLCRYHDRLTTSIALLGDYDLYDRHEFGERDYFAYLEKIYVEPDFFDPEQTSVPDESLYKISKKMKVVLFKMWRQVKFNYWVRPACLNWKTLFKDGNDLTAKFPKEAWFSGYGTTTLGGRWNRTLKRIYMKPDSCEINTADCLRCKGAFFNKSAISLQPAPRWIPNDQFCLVPSDTDGQYPCEFDLGGSVSTLEFGQTPYCLWKVFGVNVDPREDCHTGPALFRVIGGQLLAWLEDIIWYDDFPLPMFDLRWPSCAYKYEEEYFDDLIHIQKVWNISYKDPI